MPPDFQVILSILNSRFLAYETRLVYTLCHTHTTEIIKVYRMVFGQFEQKPKKTSCILRAIIVPITVNQAKKNWATVFVLHFFSQYCVWDFHMLFSTDFWKMQTKEKFCITQMIYLLFQEIGRRCWYIFIITYSYQRNKFLKNLLLFLLCSSSTLTIGNTLLVFIEYCYYYHYFYHYYYTCYYYYYYYYYSSDRL